jgi:hypothetical protein
MRLKVPRDSRTPRRRIGMSEEAPPILVRLTESIGRLPAGFIYELPEHEALGLIMRRKATAVGRYREQTADLVLTEEEWEAATA